MCVYTKEDIASGRVQVIGICYFFHPFSVSLSHFSTILRQFILFTFILNSCCAICRKDFQTFVTYSVNIFTSTVSTEPNRDSLCVYHQYVYHSAEKNRVRLGEILGEAATIKWVRTARWELETCIALHLIICERVKSRCRYSLHAMMPAMRV